MAFCTQCGQQAPEGARFCTQCGAPLRPSDELNEGAGALLETVGQESEDALNGCSEELAVKGEDNASVASEEAASPDVVTADHMSLHGERTESSDEHEAVNDTCFEEEASDDSVDQDEGEVDSGDGAFAKMDAVAEEVVISEEGVEIEDHADAKREDGAVGEDDTEDVCNEPIDEEGLPPADDALAECAGAEHPDLTESQLAAGEGDASEGESAASGDTTPDSEGHDIENQMRNGQGDDVSNGLSEENASEGIVFGGGCDQGDSDASMIVGGSYSDSVEANPPADVEVTSELENGPESSDDASKGAGSGDGEQLKGEQKVQSLGRRRIAVAAGLIVALGALAGGALWMGAGDNPGALLQLDTADALTVSRTARFVPQAADGTPLEHYVVRLKHAIDQDGNEIDVSDVPALSVEDDSGFVVDDLIAGLPDGRYTFEVDDGETKQELPQVTIDEDYEDGESGSIEIQGEETPSDTDDDPDLGMSAEELLLWKLNKLEEMHGSPTIEVYEHAGQFFSYVTGLAYAGLIDFGDGIERLLVIYNDGKHDEVPAYSDYRIEIWERDDETGALCCVLGKEGDVVAGGTEDTPYASFEQLPVAGGRMLRTTVYENDGMDQTERIWGIGDDGTIGLVREFQSQREEGSSTSTMLVDGEEVTSDEYLAMRSELFGDYTIDDSMFANLTFSYSTKDDAQMGEEPRTIGESVGTYLYPADAAATVNELRTVLQDRIDATGKDEDSTARESANKAAEEKEETDDKGASSDASGTSVSATEITETVSVPTFYTDASVSDGTENFTWGYVQLNGAGSAVKDLNQRLSVAYEDAKQEMASWTLASSSEPQCASYRQTMTCQRDGVVGITTQRYLTLWGAHGSMDLEGVVYDVGTGEEIQPWELIGMSRQELDAKAVDALVGYASSDSELPAEGTAAELRSEAQAIVDDAHYLVLDEGIAIVLPEYGMGYSYASGLKVIVAAAFDDGSLVGTDISAKYVIPLQ